MFFMSDFKRLSLNVFMAADIKFLELIILNLIEGSILSQKIFQSNKIMIKLFKKT